MTLAAEDLSDLLGAIYDCALDPGQWPATLEKIARRAGACNATIMRHGPGVASFLLYWGMTPETLAAYARTYAPINPLATVQWHCPVDEPVSLELFMTPAELRATQFHREFLAPLGWFDFILVALEKSAEVASLLSMTRLEASGPPTAAEMDFVRLIAPHMRRAVVLGGLIASETARAEDLAAVFARLAMPAFLLDAEGRCLEPNAAAQRLLGQALHPADSGPNGGSVVRFGARGGVLPGLGSMAAPASVPLTDDEGRAYVAHVVPLGAADRVVVAGGGRAAAAVFVQEVGGLAPLPGEVLVKLYGLTPAETRLLALLGRGLSLEEAAEALGVAMATARTHLARIFDKTGTRRQAELVRLVMSAFPAPPG